MERAFSQVGNQSMHLPALFLFYSSLLIYFLAFSFSFSFSFSFFFFFSSFFRPYSFCRSYGYHADDGFLYLASGNGKKYLTSDIGGMVSVIVIVIVSVSVSVIDEVMR